MVERQPRDSSRDLLEELEEGWGTPPPPQAFVDQARAQNATNAAEMRKKPAPAAAYPSPSPSNPDVDSLDEGWLDDLFPGEAGEEDEDDEPEESEPELPDEGLDPEAFALAKRAREERALKRKERKKAKLEAKRERQRARAAAVRQKQKGKKSRPANARPEPSRGARGTRARGELDEGRSPSNAKSRGLASRRSNAPVGAASTAIPSTDPTDDAIDLAAVGIPASKPRTKSRPAPANRASTIASIKLLAIVLAILLALAALVAALAK